MIFRIMGPLAISAKFREKNNKKVGNTQNCLKSEMCKCHTDIFNDLFTYLT